MGVDCMTPPGGRRGVASVRMTTNAEILPSFSFGDELRLQADRLSPIGRRRSDRAEQACLASPRG
jgi:hypothetical protein